MLFKFKNCFHYFDYKLIIISLQCVTLHFHLNSGLRRAEPGPLLRHGVPVADSVRGGVQPDQLQGEGERPAGGEQSVHQPHQRGRLQRLSAPLRPQGQHQLLQVPRQQELQDGQGEMVVCRHIKLSVNKRVEAAVRNTRHQARMTKTVDLVQLQILADQR